jgi:hypothetical protein
MSNMHQVVYIPIILGTGVRDGKATTPPIFF